jgi:hypothetical protein
MHGRHGSSCFLSLLLGVDKGMGIDPLWAVRLCHNRGVLLGVRSGQFGDVCRESTTSKKQCRRSSWPLLGEVLKQPAAQYCCTSWQRLKCTGSLVYGLVGLWQTQLVNPAAAVVPMQENYKYHVQHNVAWGLQLPGLVHMLCDQAVLQPPNAL